MHQAELAVADPLKLAEILCARICHDMAGTLGALSGMLDMQDPNGAADPEALDLARTCAHELTGRLRLFRAAWGSDSDCPDLAALVPCLPGADRLRVDVTGIAPGQPVAMRQLAASFLIVAAGALQRGGSIMLSGDGAGMTLAIEGARAAWPATLESGGGDSSLDPRSVSVAMACLQARARGLSVRVMSPTTLTIG